MYAIEKVNRKDAQSLIISNRDASIRLVIHLNEGGRITLYQHQGNTIISDLKNSSYSKNFAGAILFPFTNRIEGGIYKYNAKCYKLPCNETLNNNAIHGLVYNKTFKLISEVVEQDSASVELQYVEVQGCEGFPFKYSVLLRYTVTKEGLKLKLSAKNTDQTTFPFTLGWHPYFISSDLNQSQIFFNAKEKFIINKRGIVTGREPFKDTAHIKLGQVELDDAFAVNPDMVELTTPDYRFKIKSSLQDNHLQIYTPPNSNGVALEPMIGVSNSFNNNIGKMELEPNQNFEVEWELITSKL
ncbi:aldose 1-epimerase [Winogradskyella pulchriflava]|uniref:Aldose 1-epimerase n=1 Tax=Winogradskyella pulchriflava TaxID=1110688 RepID=A0ABV6Q5C1_9FLAO